jgi:ribose-phosphate pyrophosphokinase
MSIKSYVIFCRNVTCFKQKFGDFGSDIAFLDVNVENFADGEIKTEFFDKVQSYNKLFIINSIVSSNALLEMCFLVDLAKRVGFKDISAIIPYFGYARQDRSIHSNGSISALSAKVVAKILESSGFQSVFAIDIHSRQLEGFFNIPFYNISTDVLWAEYIKKHFKNSDIALVSPDVGGAVRVRSISNHLSNVDVVVIEKQRLSAGNSVVMNVHGDVNGRHCIIFDDMIDGGGTVLNAIDALNKSGANYISVCATHAVFRLRKDADVVLERFNNSTIKSIITTDTISYSGNDTDHEVDVKRCTKIKEISIHSIISPLIRHNIK